jgi:hypothetical protein
LLSKRRQRNAYGLDLCEVKTRPTNAMDQRGSAPASWIRIQRIVNI